MLTEKQHSLIVEAQTLLDEIGDRPQMPGIVTEEDVQHFMVRAERIDEIFSELVPGRERHF